MNPYAPTEAKLTDLDPLAEKVNAAVADLDSALREIADRLNAKQLSVEVYARTPLSYRTQPTSDANGRVVVMELLGYSRVPKCGHWALTVKTVRVVERFDTADSDEILERVTSLLNSSRELQVAAVDVIPELLGALVEAANEIISKSSKANALALSLE